MKYYTTKQAGKILSLAPSSLRVYIGRKLLFPLSREHFPESMRSLMRDSDLFFSEEELERFQEERHKVGRPRGSKKL